MINITETTTSASGKNITITGTITTKESVYCDGHRMDIDKFALNVRVSVEGHGDQGGHVIKAPAPLRDQWSQKGYPQLTHMVGALALTEEQAELVTSVWDRLKATETYKAYDAKCKANLAGHAWLDREEARINRAMGC